MNTLSAVRVARRLYFSGHLQPQLPPTPHCRPFHHHPPRQFLDLTIQTTYALFQDVHHLAGLPWALTFPLTALLIRTTLILPLHIYARHVQHQQLALQPISQAWRFQFRRTVMREDAWEGPEAIEPRLASMARRHQMLLLRRWRSGRWRLFLPAMTGLPIFLVVGETVRRMAGTQSGPLMWLGRLFGGEDAVLPRSMVEYGLATEGALWFPDLLVPDPQLVLPFVLSASLMASASMSLRRGKKEGVLQRRVRRSLMTLALVAVPFTMQVPAAMMVYWISTVWVALGHNLLLDRFMPLKTPFDIIKERTSLKVQEIRELTVDTKAVEGKPGGEEETVAIDEKGEEKRGEEKSEGKENSASKETEKTVLKEVESKPLKDPEKTS
ncbi:MAG: hypothetical protein M1829_006768 [Trizodia sp. TS-e1964]|nr:MAG: hypothetical protein M1829_006768 [Trizodia sp. TS-e1964]